ncbi:MAG: lipid A-modifier LpxR family protein, partial [Gemmatimonadota bacterium]
MRVCLRRGAGVPVDAVRDRARDVHPQPRPPAVLVAGLGAGAPVRRLALPGGRGRRVSARALRTYSLALGVTGPPALGSLAQSIAHTITAKYTTKAEGWETQVGFEPGVLLGVRQSLPALRWAPGGRGVLD